MRCSPARSHGTVTRNVESRMPAIIHVSTSDEQEPVSLFARRPVPPVLSTRKL